MEEEEWFVIYTWYYFKVSGGHRHTQYIND